MAHWKDKNQWTKASKPATGRRKGKIQSGFQGNKVDPTLYQWTYGNYPLSTPKLPNGYLQPDVDVPNSLVPGLMYDAQGNFPHARNAAWASLVENTRSGPAQLGVAFAEWKESLSMIEKRSLQLLNGYRSLRKGHFGDFLGQFGLTAKKKHRSLLKKNTFTRRKVARESANLWLEYSFGWSPLTKDIYDGAHAIGQPLPGGFCRGKGRERLESGKDGSSGEIFSTVVHCRNSAYVYVSNPNLYLLQQMGLLNPASIAWELVPFSFVVDWFTDVGSFLGGFSDFAGCTILRGSTTFSCRVYSTHYFSYPGHDDFTLGGYIGAGIRYPALLQPLPNFSIRANLGTSLRRAANAVSLLIQLFLGR